MCHLRSLNERCADVNAIDKQLRSLTSAAYTTVSAELLLELVAWQIAFTSQNQKPDAIHDLRVAIRRARNCLLVLGEFFSRRARREIRGRLRAINKLAGRVRDIDIAIEVMASVLRIPDRPIFRSFRRERRKAKRKLRKELWRWISRNELKEWHAELGFASIARKKKAQKEQSQSAKKYGKKVLPGLAGEFFSKGDTLSAYSPPEDIHKFRLQVKRFRDIMELFHPCYGSEIDPLLGAIKEIHRTLGEFNDLVNTRTMLTARGFKESRPRMFVDLDVRIGEKIKHFVSIWSQNLADLETQQRWFAYLKTRRWDS